MKMKNTLLLVVACLLAVGAHAQGVLGKLKQKAEQAAERAAEKAVDKKLGVNQGTNTSGNGSNTSGSGGSSSGGNNPSNNSGGGLISTPPDVKQNLSDAEASYKTKSYGEARYAVQQAMLGVEMEIGNGILKSLPETAVGLPKEATADQVTSTGFGWVGLTIHREYNKNDKELRITIANNAAWMSAYNLYLTNSGYSQQTNGKQNWKQIKVKGYRGVIEFNEGSGYKISVGLGQSSIIVWEGVNFATEQEITKAAETFDIDGIKKQLGEQ
jgi:hypothetical protein